MKALLTFIIAPATAALLLSSCGSEITDQRKAEILSQSANQSSGDASTLQTSPTVRTSKTPAPVSVATQYVPPTGNNVNPTEGDVVPALKNRVSCFKEESNVCVMMQTNRNDISSMERMCSNAECGAQLQSGNGCANLDITAKCNIEIKGDRFTIYNIGGLSKEREQALAEQCRGMSVGGSQFKGTFVSLTDEYQQSAGELPKEIRDLLQQLFRGIFNFLAKMFGIPVQN